MKLDPDSTTEEVSPNGPRIPKTFDDDLNEPISEVTCEACGRAFNSQQALYGHLRSHKNSQTGLKEPKGQAQPNTMSPDLTPGEDSEIVYWRGEKARLKEEVSVLRMQKEREKYQPPPKRPDTPDEMLGREAAYASMAEYWESKKDALKNSESKSSDPTINRLEATVDRLIDENKNLKEEMKTREIQGLKDDIHALREEMKNQKPSDNPTAALLALAETELKSINTKTNALITYLLSSTSKDVTKQEYEVGSAMEEEFRRRNMLQ